MMKTRLLLFAFLISTGIVSAQNTPADTLSTQPSYVYCEIIANHLPVHRENKVVFDFGQKTRAWKYNYLTNEAGDKLLFNSGMEALNHMIRGGWEFVQAYTSGKENDISHYLLRIAPSQLPEAQRKTGSAPALKKEQK